MRAIKKTLFASTALISLFALLGLVGCGPDDGGAGTGSLSAGLLVPRALADELVNVEIYIYEIDGDRRPTSDELLTPDALGSYDAYKEYKEIKKVPISIAITNEARISGIPDRGPVWRFYARGYDNNPLLIGHGAVGPVRVRADIDDPTLILIDLEAIQ
jgi:hypothetical protein